MIDNIGKFWVVTKPTELSVIEDILFETDVRGLFNQVRGGLEETNIKVMTTDQNNATYLAKKMIEAMSIMREIYNE